MQIGIFSKTFVRPTVVEVLDAVVNHDIHSIQFNLSCAGLPNMPDEIDIAVCDHIRSEVMKRNITMAAVSGTFNMIHPDPEERRRGLQQLRVLASACHQMGASIITLCTGTRDPDYLWRRHPDNDAPEAWKDLLATMGEAVEAAEAFGVTLAFEPEVSNVVDSAAKGRRLMDEIQSPHLKVVMDGANIFHAGELPRMREILNEAFDLLGDDIALAHAKDLVRDGEAGNVPAGNGVLDYDHYLSLLRTSGFDGSIVLHGLDESQVDECAAFLNRKLERSEK